MCACVVHSYYIPISGSYDDEEVQISSQENINQSMGGAAYVIRNS